MRMLPTIIRTGRVIAIAPIFVLASKASVVDGDEARRVEGPASATNPRREVVDEL